jgi:hypothetical protein
MGLVPASLLRVLALSLAACAVRAAAASAPSTHTLPGYHLAEGAAKRLFEVLGAEEPLVETDVRQLIAQLRCVSGVRRRVPIVVGM